MKLKKRTKSYIGPYIVFVLDFVIFLTSLITLGLYSESHSSTETFGMFVVSAFAFFFGMSITYIVWTSVISHRLKKAAESRKLEGKVFIKDLTSLKDLGYYCNIPFRLIPKESQVNSKEEADFILYITWCQAELGRYAYKGSGQMTNRRAVQRYCSVSIYNQHAVYRDEYVLGVKGFSGSLPPIEIVEPLSASSADKPVFIYGSWPEEQVEAYIRSRLPEKAI